MDRARLDSWLEKGILGIVLTILVIGPLLFGAVRVREFEIIQGLTALATLLWAIRLWTREEHRLLLPPFAFVVAIFLGYALWHYTRADVQYVARLEVNRVITYAALFFIILDSLNRQEWSQAIVVTVVFVGMAMAMYAVYQYVTGSKWIYHTPQPPMYYGRASGPYVCPNHLAGYLAMVIPLGLSLAVGGRFNVVTKVLLGYAALVMMAGVYVTVSRGGWIAAAIGLCAFFGVLIFRPGFRLAAIVMLVLLLGAGGWFAANSYKMKKRVEVAMQPLGAVHNDRVHVWNVAREIWQESFWTGAGPAHFDLRFRLHRPPLQQLQGRPNRAHNDYLNTLADWGFVGLSIIAAGMAVFWIGALRIWRFVRRGNDFGSKQSTRAATVLGASAGLLAILAHSMVDFNMQIPANAILAVTLLAVVTGHARFATERFWFNPRVGGRVLATLAALAGVAWLGAQAVRLRKEQALLLAADRSPYPSQQRLDYLRAAAAIEPTNPVTAYDIGDQIRRLNWDKEKDFAKPAAEALAWFRKAATLDPFNAAARVGIGMAHHWVGNRAEAWPEFREAIAMDRNNYFIRAHYGWHFAQLQAWDRALEWFMRSLWMRPAKDNPIAAAYYEIAKRRASEETYTSELARRAAQLQKENGAPQSSE